MLISFVLPCYNEAENVRPMHDWIVETMQSSGFDYEMVFVDDGSRDETYAKLKEIYQTTAAHVRVVRFSRNFGKESAIFAGLQYAAGDIVTLIDADLQQSPVLAREMAEFLRDNDAYDCVAAFQSQRREGKVTAFLKNGFYKLMNRVTEIEFVQGASDFRTMRRSMVDAILSMTEHNRFSKGIFSWVGFATRYVPYVPEDRHAGSTKWNTWKLFKYAFDGIVSFTTMPLRLSAFAGVAAALGSLVYMLVIIIQKICFGIAVPGYATLVVLILLLGGIQLFGMGILGEYLAKTYVESKRRPIYLAREILDSSSLR
ncbi:MAG: glycosyltransferase family 2 protein [Oscillospiraceae bacterium]|nr:glycosyltransferase family 2 protein [Oscillospiraceae bacterium]